MTRIAIPLAAAAFVASIAATAAAQPAPEANEHAQRNHAAAGNNCQRMYDDYLKQKQWLDSKPPESGKKDKADKLEEKDLDKMLKDYEKQCGKLDDDKKDKPKTGAAGVKQKIEDAKDKGKEKDEPAKPPVTTAAATPTAPVELPRKAGPSEGAGVGSTRCEDLHKKMKDALARKDACGKDKKCKNTEEFGYDQLRNAFRNGGCGDIPADAEPRKGKR